MKEINNNEFFIDNNRAMISLGPLTEYKYCPYSCAFCYVKSGFNKYPYLKINRKKYNIIYISGDTDSFAPPRTSKAIELLEKISKSIDVDITFTTRTVFKTEDIKRLKNISDYMKTKNYKLIASISISRLNSSEFIEPKPIPKPEERIELIKRLKENGIYTMLAVRPFLPIIDSKEYICSGSTIFNSSPSEVLAAKSNLTPCSPINSLCICHTTLSCYFAILAYISIKQFNTSNRIIAF